MAGRGGVEGFKSDPRPFFAFLSHSQIYIYIELKKNNRSRQDQNYGIAGLCEVFVFFMVTTDMPTFVIFI